MTNKPMKTFDLEFECASIDTRQIVFAAELESNFAQWSRIPSSDMPADIAAWRKLGASRARLAHDQAVTSYYREIGHEELLPESLQLVQERDAFEEWKKIAITMAMANEFDAFGHLRRLPPKIKDKRAKEMVEAALRQKGIGFESSAKPLFRAKTGCVVYLDVMQRKHVVDAQMICCRNEVPMPLAKHCGLHTIVRGCEAQTLTGSPDAVEIVANEIVRHVELMREKLTNLNTRI